MYWGSSGFIDCGGFYDLLYGRESALDYINRVG